MRARFVAIAMVCFSGWSISGACTSALYDVGTSDSISFSSTTFPDDSVISDAMSRWNGCAGAGVGFPRLSSGTSGAISIAVEFQNTYNPKWVRLRLLRRLCSARTQRDSDRDRRNDHHLSLHL